jgi:TRAP transporter TAXI family solute receptor
MKTFGKSMVLVVFLVILTMGIYGETQAKTQLQMPLGGVRGSYYMIGAPTAKYINDKSSMISVTPNTSGGGVENIRRVSQGEAQLGMATAMEMQKSWHGIAPFKKQMRAWRTIGIATKILINNTVALQKSNIRKIEDVKGKVFAIGAPGSAAAASMLEFLEFTGLAKQITMRKLPHKDYPTMLMDGKIDIFNRLGATPSGSVEQVAAQRKINLVDFGSMMEKTAFIEKHPYYQKAVVKGGTYKGVGSDVTLFGLAGYLITREDVPIDIVYEFTRLAYSEGCIRSVSMAFKGNNLNRTNPLQGNIGPVHPGAAKFWREIGISVPPPVLK